MPKRSFVKDSISVFITKIIVVLMSVLGVVVLARGLGPENRGVLAALLVYPQLLISLTEGGMRQSATLFIGKSLARDGEVLAALIAYVVTAGFLGYIAIASLLWLVGNEKFSLAMILVSAAIIPTTLSVNALKGYFLGKQSIKSFNKSSWVQSMLYVAILAALYVMEELTVTTAVSATFFASLFNAVQAWFYIRKMKPDRLQFECSVIFRMLKIGFVYAIALFLVAANYKLDILLLDYLSDSKALGYYAVSVQISEIMWQLPGALMLVLMSRSANNKLNAEIWTKNVALVCRMLIAVGIISALAMTLFILTFMTFIFGEQYHPAVNVSIMLVLASIFMIPFKILNADFAGEGNPKFSIYIMLPSVVINVVFNFLLIPNWGAMGAALATCFSYFVCCVIVLIFYSRRKKVLLRNLVLVSRDDFYMILGFLKRG